MLTRFSKKLALFSLFLFLAGGFIFSAQAQTNTVWSGWAEFSPYDNVPIDGPVNVVFQNNEWTGTAPMNIESVMQAIIIYKIEPVYNDTDPMYPYWEYPWYSTPQEIPLTAILPQSNYNFIWSDNNGRLTILFDPWLEASQKVDMNGTTAGTMDNSQKRYGIMLNSGAEDINGVRQYPDTYSSFTFATSWAGVNPIITNNYPYERMTGFMDQAITFGFNTPMDLQSLNNNFSLVKYDLVFDPVFGQTREIETEIPGTITEEPSEMATSQMGFNYRFTPADGFPAEAYLEYEIRTGAFRRGMPQANLAHEVDALFTTGSLMLPRFDVQASTVTRPDFLPGSYALYLQVEGPDYEIKNLTEVRVTGPGLPETTGVTLEPHLDGDWPNWQARFPVPFQITMPAEYTFTFVDRYQSVYEPQTAYIAMPNTDLAQIVSPVGSPSAPFGPVNASGITFEFTYPDYTKLDEVSINIYKINSPAMPGEKIFERYFDAKKENMLAVRMPDLFLEPGLYSWNAMLTNKVDQLSFSMENFFIVKGVELTEVIPPISEPAFDINGKFTFRMDADFHHDQFMSAVHINKYDPATMTFTEPVTGTWDIHPFGTAGAWEANYFPMASLAPGTTYEVMVNTFNDLAGKPVRLSFAGDSAIISAVYNIKTQTMGSGDLPYITGTIPFRYEKNVSPHSSFTFNFSGEVPFTEIQNKFSLYTQSGLPLNEPAIAGTWSLGSVTSEIIFTPTMPLEGGRNYVMISTDVVYLDPPTNTVPMPGLPFSSTFTTLPEMIEIGRYPVFDTLNPVNPDAAVVFTFSKLVHANTVAQSFMVIDTETQMPVPGAVMPYPQGDMYCNELHFSPNELFIEGKGYSAVLGGNSLINPDGNPYAFDPIETSHFFFIAMVSPRIFDVQPDSVVVGNPLDLQISGINLDKIVDVSVLLDEGGYDIIDSNITVTSPAAVTGVSNETMTLGLAVSKYARTGFRKLSFTDIDSKNFIFENAFNVIMDVINTDASVISFKNPIAGGPETYGFGFSFDAPWEIWDTVTSVRVNGPGVPDTGFNLTKNYQSTFNPSFEGIFILPAGVTPEFTSEYTFTIDFNDNTTKLRTAMPQGSLYMDYPYDIQPYNETLNNIYEKPILFNHSTNPGTPNAYANSAGVQEISFMPVDPAQQDKSLLIFPDENSYDNVIYNFSKKISPGVVYNIEVRRNTEDWFVYNINNFVLPIEEGKKPVVAFYFPEDITVTSPFLVTIIPDRFAETGAAQGGIEQYAVLGNNLDLSAPDGQTVFKNVSAAGMEPEPLAIPNVPAGVYPDPTRPFEASRYSIPGLFPAPGTVAPTGTLAGDADPVDGYLLLLEKEYIPTGVTEPQYNYIGHSFYEAAWLQHDFATEKYMIWPNIQETLEPGNYRYWIMASRASDGNGAAAPAFFNIGAGATVTHIPEAGAVISPNEPIALIFSNLMDTYSVEGSFKVMQHPPLEGTYPVPGTFMWQINEPVAGTTEEFEHVMIWTPSNPLKQGQPYDVICGSPEMPMYSADWKIVPPVWFPVSVAQGTGLSVMETHPGNNFIDVPVQTDVRILFNDSITSADASASFSFAQLVPDTATGTVQEIPMMGQTIVTENELRFIPENNLLEGARYGARIAGSMRGVTLEAMGADFIFSFKTYDSTVAPVYGPYVVSHTPAYNAYNVPLDAKVKVEFSKPMDVLSVLGDTATNTASRLIFTPVIQGSWQTDTNASIFTFTPLNNLSPSTKYTLQIRPNVLDTDGNPMGYEFTFDFTSGEEGVVGDVPAVVYHYPGNNETSVYHQNQIFIDFSKPMNHSATEQAITISPATEVAYSWINTGDIAGGTTTTDMPQIDTLNISPVNGFEYGTQYTVTIGTGAVDTSDPAKALPKAYSFKFTTENSVLTNPPAVMSIFPQNNMTNIPLDAHVTVNFTKTMDQTVTQSNLKVELVTTAGITNVPGSWQWFNTSADFTPFLPFPANSNIRVTVGAAAADTSSPALTIGSDIVHNFTTIADGAVKTPVVLATIPENNGTGVLTGAYITINFDQPMDQTATQSALIYSPSIVPRYAWAGTSLLIMPESKLTSNTVYTVKVTKSAKNYLGIAMAADYEFKFTTSSSTSTNPVVLGSLPINGSTNVPVGAVIAIKFDKEMDQTITESAITVSPALSDFYTQWNYEGVKIIPVNMLTAGTTYTVRVSTAAKDINQTSLAAGYSFTFTTAASTAAAPSVVATMPFDGEVNVPLDASMRISFSQAMNQSITDNAISIYPDVEGYSWWEGNDIVFKAQAGSLQPDTFYSVTVDSSAMNENYIPMSKNFSFGFKTASAVVDAKAFVTSVTPMPGMNEVDVNSQVVLNFSESMKTYETELAISVSQVFYDTDPTNTSQINGTSVLGSFVWSNSNKTASFTPQVPLLMGTQYNVTVSPSAVTQSGAGLNPFMSMFFTRFDTSLDQTFVTYTMPTNGDMMVPVDVPLFIGFNRTPSDKLFVENSIALTPDAGTLAFKWNNDIDLEITKSSPFAPDTSYTLTLTPENGAPVFILNFKTGSAVATGLTVTRTFPDNGAVGVPLNQLVEIVFSSDMNKDLFTGNYSFVKKSDNSAVANTLAWYAPNMVTITPAAALMPGASYEVTVNPAAADIKGNTLTNGYTLGFTARQISDQLMVLSTSPRNDQFEVASTSTIQVIFNKVMDKASVEQGFTLSPSVSGSFSWATETVNTSTIHKMTFKPVQALAKGVSYFANIKQTVKSLDGKTLAAPYSFSFSTEFSTSQVPMVVNTMPMAGMLEVPASTEIGLMFNMPMDKTSVQSAIVITPSVTGITYSWTEDSRGLLLKPGTALTAGTRYSVVLKTTAKSAESTPQYALAHSFAFTTASASGLVPAVINVWPKNGSIEQPLFTAVDFEFNKEMNTSADAASLFTITPGVTFEASWSPMGNMISLFPSNLQPETQYTVTLSKAAADKDGVSLAADKTSTFTTIKKQSAPIVLTTLPADAAADVALNQQVIVNFSQYIDPISDDQAITLTPEPAQGYWKEWWGKTLIIHPQPALTADTLYTVNIGNATKMPSSYEGVPMAAAVSFTFTTGQAAQGNPYVTVTEPVSGMTDLPYQDIYISVNFSERLDEASIKTALSITPDLQGTLYSYDGYGFGYQAKGAADTTYTVSISDAAHKFGTDGTEATSKLLPYTFNFKTMAAETSKAPEIVATIPGADEIDVPVKARLTIAFSTAMDKTKTEAAITITPETEGIFEWTDGMVTFIPAQRLKSLTSYSVQVAKTAVSADAVALAETYVYSFKTAALTTPPKVISVLPTPGFTSVPSTTEFTATFDMSMDAFATSKAFTITPATEGSLLWRDEKTLVFMPSTALSNGTRYKATISNAAKGINGITMETAYEWQFTTSLTESNAPTVVFTEPFDKADSVSLKKAITVKFSADMKQVETSQAFIILPPVTGSVTWVSSKEMVFTPTTGYSKESDYWVNIGTGAVSRTGEAMTSPFVFGFSTKVPVAEVVSPAVLSTVPEDHKLEVPVNTAIKVSFNMAMNRILTESNFEIFPPVSGRFSWNEITDTNGIISEMTFTPAENLPGGTEIEMKVLGFSDAGVPMDNPYYFEFDTKVEDFTNPFLTHIYPQSGDTKVLPGATLEIGFSEPMKTASADGNIILSYIDDAGASVALTPVLNWKYENTWLEIKTSDPLIAGKSYKLVIKEGLADEAGINLEKGRFIVFTVFNDQQQFAAGSAVWKKTLEGRLSNPAMMRTGLAVISNDAGKVFCLSPDGSKLWDAAAPGTPAVNRPVSILPDNDPVLFAADSVVYTIEKLTGAIEEGLNPNAGTDWSGPLTRDEDGTILGILNSATGLKISALIPTDAAPKVKWEHELADFKAFSSVLISKSGSYVFSAQKISTGIPYLFEYTKSGTKIFETPLSQTAAVPSQPAISFNYYITDSVSKLFAVEKGVVTEHSVNADGQTPVITGLTSPVAGNNNLIFMGASTDSSAGAVVVFDPSNSTFAIEETTAPITIEPMVMTSGLVYAYGTKIRHKPAVNADSTILVTENDWIYDLEETVTGLSVNNNGSILAVGITGAAALIQGVPNSALLASAWPKVNGNVFNLNFAFGRSDGFIKNAAAETMPFQAAVNTTVNFNAYASVTYRTSSVPEITSFDTDFDMLNEPTQTASAETFIDTIIIQTPNYLTDLAYVGVTNLFGDDLDATATVNADIHEIVIALATPIYDSPAVQFRGVNVVFTAKTPALVPTTLDNKIKVIMGSSSSREFVMAVEGDGDAGGMVMRNATSFEVISSASTVTAVVTEALLEIQPKMIASNAGGKDSAGAQLAYEKVSANILVPSTATLNPKGINLINVVVPSGIVVSGVAVSKNGDVLKKTTNYLTSYSAGDPIYNIYFVNSFRRVDIGSSGLKIKIEFTITTPDTIWMTPINASLGYVNDFNIYLGKPGTATTFVTLPPVSCTSGNADGTAGNGDGNMILIQPKNQAPQARNLTPVTTLTKPVADRFNIQWESMDPDSLVEYRLFYSTDDTLDLTAGANTAAYPVSFYPVFDFNNLSAFDSAKKLSYVWNIAEKTPQGEYKVPAGRYTIYALADDGVNPLVQIKSAGKVIVERSTSNSEPVFAFTNLDSDLSADKTASLTFTVADADADSVEYELYFYPVKDVLRAMECYDAEGSFITASISTDGTAPSQGTAVWDTEEVPAGSYLVLAWYGDGKGLGQIKWSDHKVVIAHSSVSDNVPPQFEWVKPSDYEGLAIPENDKLALEFKALDTDDANAKVTIYYNTVQAENKDLMVLKEGFEVADTGTSLNDVTSLTHDWDTSKLANGFYYLLAKVKENKVVEGNPVPTPSLRFWCDTPILIDKAQESGLGEIQEANLTHNSVTIKFTSTLPTTGKVKYGVNGVITSSADDPAGLIRNHMVMLENLTPGTTYYYSVEATGSKGTYVMDNKGEYYSFKTLAAPTTSNVDHWIGGNVGKANALVTLYLEKAAVTTKPGILAAPELSVPIVVRTDSSGKWSANVGTAVSASGQALVPTTNDTVKLEVRGDDGKVSVPAPQALTDIGAHTSSNNAVSTETGTLSSVMTHELSLNAGFNLVALPINPSTKMTARDFLILAGNNAIALYHYDAASAGYKSVVRIADGDDKVSGFLGDSLELDMVKGFFVKMKEAVKITLSGVKLQKPQALSLRTGFNMLTVGYGKNFPFSVKTGTTAKDFLKQLGNDGLAVYSYSGSAYQSLLRTADGSDDTSFLGTDFDLVTGQAYFFKVKNSAGIVPGE